MKSIAGTIPSLLAIGTFVFFVLLIAGVLS